MAAISYTFACGHEISGRASQRFFGVLFSPDNSRHLTVCYGPSKATCTNGSTKLPHLGCRNCRSQEKNFLEKHLMSLLVQRDDARLPLIAEMGQVFCEISALDMEGQFHKLLTPWLEVLAGTIRFQEYANTILPAIDDTFGFDVLQEVTRAGSDIFLGFLKEPQEDCEVALRAISWEVPIRSRFQHNRIQDALDRIVPRKQAEREYRPAHVAPASGNKPDCHGLAIKQRAGENHGKSGVKKANFIPPITAAHTYVLGPAWAMLEAGVVTSGVEADPQRSLRLKNLQLGLRKALNRAKACRKEAEESIDLLRDFGVTVNDADEQRLLMGRAESSMTSLWRACMQVQECCLDLKTFCRRR
ncbi:hypothetical protein F4780DRAFT_757993 [Xylariomycetidae sp. FL0641]|nr:hypothetical protein F4780DRAFT_757993 [Xylariomycetidae sp. FL0641]